jgi:hypothetical protein
MKSFRLDPDSVTEFLDSWPALAIGSILAGLSFYFGMTHHWGLVCAVLLCGTYGGYLLRGVGARRLQEKYPGARWIWLLMAGMMTAVLGVGTGMAFPQVHGTAFDKAWLAMSFFSILIFVLINRKNKSVIQ